MSLRVLRFERRKSDEASEAAKPPISCTKEILNRPVARGMCPQPLTD
jgi:hypothetical protein